MMVDLDMNVDGYFIFKNKATDNGYFLLLPFVYC
jgi:hypothetical protein